MSRCGFKNGFKRLRFLLPGEQECRSDVAAMSFSCRLADV
jgi:hypothetical protein